MRVFCTYFDSRYLARVLALIASLRRHTAGFRLWALCLDDESHAALTRLNVADVVPIRLEEFETDDGELLAAKGNRSLIEYYFTCTSSLPLYVLRRDPTVSMVTYLDADLFFFSSPEPIFDEIGDASIAIVPHRFPPGMRRWEEYGIYNVGWITFRRDRNALACLEWWRDQCLAWCSDRIDGARFADQKYLDDWPNRFPSVHVIQHKGADVASWNVGNYHISSDAAGPRVDGERLIFFHFHHVRRRGPWLLETDFDIHEVTPSRALKREIFTPYLRVLGEQARIVAALGVSAVDQLGLRGTDATHRMSFIEGIRGLAAGRLMVYVNGSVR